LAVTVPGQMEKYVTGEDYGTNYIKKPMCVLGSFHPYVRWITERRPKEGEEETKNQKKKKKQQQRRGREKG